MDYWEALYFTRGRFMVVMAMVTDIRCTHAVGLDFITKKQPKGSKPPGLLPFYISRT
ncbi:hypothetical protein [Cytobacillus oceanisediminis]|uniref:hypothetical protein n=1 Tax=Cytobacillus oceanisediminis TaxID=665099 RepID=UPI001642D7E2